MDATEIFGFLARKSKCGPTALVTVTRVAGSSMRNPGAHLAVAADGDWMGSLSGGCIEAAVVAEAVDALANGYPREVRFGAGSPYIDIKLPCGGSIDVLVNLIDDPSISARATRLFEARQPFVLGLPLGIGEVTIEPGAPTWRTRRSAQSFHVSHLPRLNVVIIGHGASVEALDAQARTIGATTRVFTPDEAIVDRLAGTTPVTLLRMPSDRVALGADAWTAIAFVFHDHDWEAQLLVEALGSPAFYVGAMGGRIANARRAAMLERAGVPAEHITRLRAPIGLIASSREPQVLALSALSEIVRDFGDVTERADIEEDIAVKRAPVSRRS